MVGERLVMDRARRVGGAQECVSGDKCAEGYRINLHSGRGSVSLGGNGRNGRWFAPLIR